MVLGVRVEEACVHQVVLVGTVDNLALLVVEDNFVEGIEDDRNVDLPEVDVEYKLVVVLQELVGHKFVLSQVHIRVVVVVPVVVLAPEEGRMMVGIHLKQDLGIAAVEIVEGSEIVVEIVVEVDEKVDEMVVDVMVDEGVDGVYEEADVAIDVKMDDLDESLDVVIGELDKPKMLGQQEHNFHLVK